MKKGFISSIKNYILEKWFIYRLPKITGFTYQSWEHSSWGNAIYIGECHKPYTPFKAYGFLRRKPFNGDIIDSKMVSGNIGRFLVIDSKRNDAAIHDYFSCRLYFLGYVKKNR